MIEPMPAHPTAQDAARIVRAVFDDEPEMVQRFPIGLCHYVFDVVTKKGRQLVVRIADPANRVLLEGAVRWSQLLRPLGVPLPRLLHADLEFEHGRLPYIILERLAGTDLGNVYISLSRAEKRAIAAKVVHVQRLVAELPQGRGFGHATSYETIPHRTWKDVIDSSLNRSQHWLAAAGVIDPCVAEPVRVAAVQFERYFENVRRVPFLDDTTTKNVIIDSGGQLSGIVDVDEICFGDPLLTPALARMALLARGFETDYIDYWCEELPVSAEQRRVLTFYTAMFCVNFLAEIGQPFNSDQPPSVEQQTVNKLQTMLRSLVDELA